jgi:hypothetical protein
LPGSVFYSSLHRRSGHELGRRRAHADIERRLGVLRCEPLTGEARVKEDLGEGSEADRIDTEVSRLQMASDEFKLDSEDLLEEILLALKGP